MSGYIKKPTSLHFTSHSYIYKYSPLISDHLLCNPKSCNPKTKDVSSKYYTNFNAVDGDLGFVVVVISLVD